jgi:hypothetical protein
MPRRSHRHDPGADVAGGARPAEKDAATKAREGDVNHWIEYYRKNREPAAAPPTTRQNGAAKKEDREKK